MRGSETLLACGVSVRFIAYVLEPNAYHSLVYANDFYLNDVT
jgi:hypothetical protein